MAETPAWAQRAIEYQMDRNLILSYGGMSNRPAQSNPYNNSNSSGHNSSSANAGIITQRDIERMMQDDDSPTGQRRQEQRQREAPVVAAVAPVVVEAEVIPVAAVTPAAAAAPGSPGRTKHRRRLFFQSNNNNNQHHASSDGLVPGLTPSRKTTPRLPFTKRSNSDCADQEGGGGGFMSLPKLGYASLSAEVAESQQAGARRRGYRRGSSNADKAPPLPQQLQDQPFAVGVGVHTSSSSSSFGIDSLGQSNRSGRDPNHDMNHSNSSNSSGNANEAQPQLAPTNARNRQQRSTTPVNLLGRPTTPLGFRRGRRKSGGENERRHRRGSNGRRSDNNNNNNNNDGQPQQQPTQPPLTMAFRGRRRGSNGEERPRWGSTGRGRRRGSSSRSNSRTRASSLPRTRSGRMLLAHPNEPLTSNSDHMSNSNRNLHEEPITSLSDHSGLLQGQNPPMLAPVIPTRRQARSSSVSRPAQNRVPQPHHRPSPQQLHQQERRQYQVQQQQQQQQHYSERRNRAELPMPPQSNALGPRNVSTSSSNSGSPQGHVSSSTTANQTQYQPRPPQHRHHQQEQVPQLGDTGPVHKPSPEEASATIGMVREVFPRMDETRIRYYVESGKSIRTILSLFAEESRGVEAPKSMPEEEPRRGTPSPCHPINVGAGVPAAAALGNHAYHQHRQHHHSNSNNNNPAADPPPRGSSTSWLGMAAASQPARPPQRAQHMHHFTDSSDLEGQSSPDTPNSNISSESHTSHHHHKSKKKKKSDKKKKKKKRSSSSRKNSRNDDSLRTVDEDNEVHDPSVLFVREAFPQVDAARSEQMLKEKSLRTVMSILAEESYATSPNGNTSRMVH